MDLYITSQLNWEQSFWRVSTLWYLTSKAFPLGFWKSLHQNVSHGLDDFVTIVWCVRCHITTRVCVVTIPPSTQSQSAITAVAVILFIVCDTDSCFRTLNITTNGIESLFIAVWLQGGLWSNQCLPRVTTQWGGSVLPVCDERVQRVSLLVDD